MYLWFCGFRAARRFGGVARHFGLGVLIAGAAVAVLGLVV